MNKQNMKELNVEELKKELSYLKSWLSKDEINKCIDCFKKNTNKEILKFKSPSKDFIFNAFKIGPRGEIIKPEDVKVLVIGQDPYPETRKACGLAFLHNTEEYKDTDATLKNIITAIDKSETLESKKLYNESMYLEWAKDNKVLLLNTALTHEDKDNRTIKKHKEVWKEFITLIIEKLFNNRKKPLVVILWGKPANLLDKFNESRKDKENEKILILRSSHPSNLGKNYCGNYQCRTLNIVPAFADEGKYIFEKCNAFLGNDTVFWKDLKKIYRKSK